MLHICALMFCPQLKKYFTFEVQVLDDKNVRRRFRASNYQSTTRVKPFICTMPMRLDEGWNQIQFNLSDFTRRAYGTNYIETLRVQIHANCRIRRYVALGSFVGFEAAIFFFIVLVYRVGFAVLNSDLSVDFVLLVLHIVWRNCLNRVTQDLLFRSFVLRGGVTGRVQTVSPHPEAVSRVLVA
jgi:hypothetical protein